MRLRGILAVGLAALAAIILAACTGDGTNVLVTGATPEQSATADKAGFNPFSTQPETSIGAREVIANPTLAEVMLTGDLPEMSWGSATAPVTLIKYASLTCPHCKRFHADVFPELKRAYIDTGKVRFILREFPIGKSSGTATVVLRCAAPDKYLALYGKFLEQQPSWVSQEVRTDQIGRVAAQVGITGDQLSACLKNQSLVAQLNWVKERGRTLGVIGTPNFFLNDKLIKSTLDWPSLRTLIEARLNGGPQAKTN